MMASNLSDSQTRFSESISTQGADSMPLLRDKPNSEDGIELKLVYRILRLISDWTLSGFFSEVYAEGAENVLQEGPLILTPCHHNEIIDIATLSATIPHRRIISYWAKASLFKNPVSRFILTSAGALPVARSPRSQEANKVNSYAHRNPNDIVSSSSTSNERRSPNGGQQVLFDATYKELVKKGGGILGVFPEGTSYTLPRIVQVKEGAARAALGYVRWHVGDSPGDARILSRLVSVVPVGIVYTDKSRYQSRLHVRYGTPIDLYPFISHCFARGFESKEQFEAEYQEAVRMLMEEIEQRMLELTINAPNWETLYAARMSRVILWPDERSLALKDFVKVSKVLIGIFERPLPELWRLKKSLLRYHALLSHTGLTHEALLHIPPPPNHSHQESRSDSEVANRTVLGKRSVTKLTVGLPLLLVPPLLSFPAHLAHIPAYISAAVASRALAADEEEGRAQFKAIIGGAGQAFGTFATGFALVRSTAGRSLLQSIVTVASGVSKSCFGIVGRVLRSVLPLSGSESLDAFVEKVIGFVGIAASFVRSGWSRLGGFGDWIGAFGIAWLLVAWHARVINSDYIRYKRARATLTVLRAVLFTRRVGDVGEDDLKPYLSTPPPPINPFIARSLQVFPEDSHETSGAETLVETTENVRDDAQDSAKVKGGKVSKSALVRYLLLARAEAVGKLHEMFRKLGDEDEDSSGREAPREDGTVAGFELLRACGAAF